MMFDSVNFGVAVMTEKALTQLDQNKLTYNYAWYYQKEPKDDAAQKKMSDRFLEKLTKKVIVTSYVPRYANKAINFTGDDMGGDKAMFILFDYIVIVILAFVFAITTSNTIAKEAGSDRHASCIGIYERRTLKTLYGQSGSCNIDRCGHR